MTTKKVRTKSTSIQKILEFATGLTKLPQSLGLDLPDPGKLRLLPDSLSGSEGEEILILETQSLAVYRELEANKKLLKYLQPLPKYAPPAATTEKPENTAESRPSLFASH